MPGQGDPAPAAVPSGRTLMAIGRRLHLHAPSVFAGAGRSRAGLCAFMRTHRLAVGIPVVRACAAVLVLRATGAAVPAVPLTQRLGAERVVDAGLLLSPQCSSAAKWLQIRKNALVTRPPEHFKPSQKGPKCLKSEIKSGWRRCMGVEPTLDQEAGRATVLKTARPTGTRPPPGAREPLL